jgi:hypothetical protein
MILDTPHAQPFFSLAEAALTIHVLESRLRKAYRTGVLPLPARVSGRVHVLTPADVETARRHFHGEPAQPDDLDTPNLPDVRA